MRAWPLVLMFVAPGCLPLELPSDAPVDAPPIDAPRMMPDAGTPPADLDGYVAWHMAEGGIHGLAAATLRGGAIERTFTYGIARGTDPVDEHTLFLVASVSKTVVAALLLQLVEAGRLDLDADIATYLGYPVRHPLFSHVVITTRMLATHTTGLTDDWIALGRATTTGADSTTTLAEFADDYLNDATAAERWDDEAPGSRRIYCNAGFGILGAIVEAAGGMPLPEQSEARIFGPLNLDGASWLLADTDTARLATEQVFQRATGTYGELPPYGWGFYPATSLRISVTGLARWVLAHARGGELDGTRVLMPASMMQLTRAQFAPVSSGQHFVWYTNRLGTTIWNGHTGSASGTSAMVLYREDGSGLVLLTNSDAYLRNRFGDSRGDAAIDAIASRLLEESGLP